MRIRQLDRGSGQSKTENGKSMEENQVSTTSSLRERMMEDSGQPKGVTAFFITSCDDIKLLSFVLSGESLIFFCRYQVLHL